MNKCSLCIHIRVVFSDSQKPYGQAYDTFTMCNRIKCQLEIDFQEYKGIVLKEGSLKGGWDPSAHYGNISYSVLKIY